MDGVVDTIGSAMTHRMMHRGRQLEWSLEEIPKLQTAEAAGVMMTSI